jgi:hypothetical protein
MSGRFRSVSAWRHEAVLERLEYRRPDIRVRQFGLKGILAEEARSE